MGMTPIVGDRLAISVPRLPDLSNAEVIAGIAPLKASQPSDSAFIFPCRNALAVSGAVPSANWMKPVHGRIFGR